MASKYLQPLLEEMEPEMFQVYLRYHMTICERQDMVGVSHHLLDVFQKQ